MSIERYVGKFEKVSFDTFNKGLDEKLNARSSIIYPEKSTEHIKNFVSVVKKNICENAGSIYANITLPRRGTTGSAGYDFAFPFDMTLHPYIKYWIPTGIKCRIRDGWYLKMVPRSSWGNKYGCLLLGGTTVIDSDYYNNPKNEGMIYISFMVDTVFSVKAGDRFVQGIFQPYGLDENEKINPVTSTRVGETGSTDNKPTDGPIVNPDLTSYPPRAILKRGGTEYGFYS